MRIRIAEKANRRPLFSTCHQTFANKKYTTTILKPELPERETYQHDKNDDERNYDCKVILGAGSDRSRKRLCAPHRTTPGWWLSSLFIVESSRKICNPEHARWDNACNFRAICGEICVCPNASSLGIVAKMVELLDRDTSGMRNRDFGRVVAKGSATPPKRPGADSARAKT